jgi:hypothetical protein
MKNTIKLGDRVRTKEVEGVSLATSGLVKIIHDDFCTIANDNNEMIAIPYDNIYAINNVRI